MLFGGAVVGRGPHLKNAQQAEKYTAKRATIPQEDTLKWVSQTGQITCTIHILPMLVIGAAMRRSKRWKADSQRLQIQEEGRRQ